MWLLARISAFSALGGFLFGYDLGLIGGALLEMSKEMDIDNNLTKETIVGAAKFGAFFGTFIGGTWMLRYGRKRAIAFSSVFFVAGPIIMAAAWGSGALIFGRLVIGLGIGASALVVPAYLGEIAPAHRRGAVVIVYEMMLCVGMLAASLVDYGLQGAPNSWRWMVGVPVFPGALMALSVLVLPESPRWLVMRGRLAEALDCLHYVIGGTGGTALMQGSGGNQAPVSAEMMAAEDELLLLWSAVEKDKAAVLERRAEVLAARLQQPMRLTAATSVSVSMDVPLMLRGSSDGSALLHQQQRSPPRPGPPQAEADCVVSLAASPGGAGNSTESKLPESAGAQLPQASMGLPAMDTKLLPSSMPRSDGSPVPSAGQSGQGASIAEPGCERTVLHTLWAMLLDIYVVARGNEQRAFVIALFLAFFDQANASTAIINFAPTILRRLGSLTDRNAILYASAINITKTVGVAIGLCVIDRVGRRPLLIWGGVGCAVCLAAITGAVAAASVAWVVVTMCLFILAFSVSWAGGYWVLVSELFSMSAKSPASSAATSLLFLSGSATNFVFLSLTAGMGAYSFLIFAVVALLSAAFVARTVPETKGRTLLEIQALLAPGCHAPGARPASSAGRGQEPAV